MTGGVVPTEQRFAWVNTVLGNVKNALHGTYHALRHKYLQRYLSEFCYRFNRRFDLAALVPRLLYAAVRTPPLPYKLATLGNQEHVWHLIRDSPWSKADLNSCPAAHWRTHAAGSC